MSWIAVVAASPGFASDAGVYSIEVIDRGAREVRAISSSTLYERVVALVESSSAGGGDAHSESESPDRGPHTRYRDEVRGSYLILSFREPRELGAGPGTLEVAEIIVGLNRSDGVSSLFLIDGGGQLISRSSYSSELAAQLLRSVRAVPEAPSTFGRAPGRRRAAVGGLRSQQQPPA